MNRPRVIPTLLIQDGNLVKTKRFSSPQYLGDPINAIRIFNEKCVDELCILDITASKNNKEPDYELLKNMASEAFMPLSYGGGITSVDQIKKLFRMGYEKAVINSVAYSDTELVRNASSYFGKQSIVCAIDYRKGITGYHCYTHNGTKKTGLAPHKWAQVLVDAGAGELLIYAIDRDGMREGYDLKTVELISGSVSVPVIACGGAGSLSDIKSVLDSGADAVAAGSLFVFFGKKQAVLINYPEEKEFVEYGIYS